MKIKQPHDDNALRGLGSILDDVNIRLKNCIANKHDTAIVLYVSSLIISPGVAYQGVNLLDVLKQIVTSAPHSVVCVVRTNTPYYFHGAMRNLQRSAINRLRNNCYVVLYSRQREFLNHAKFLVYYQVCFSKGIVHHARYYGSTNITAAGLSRYRNRVGNYEEFTFSRPRLKYDLNRRDRYYIDEVEELITDKARLYTDLRYRREYLSEHMNQINEATKLIKRTLSGTTLDELFGTYVESAVTYNQTLSLLDHVPGKKLTQETIEKLMSVANDSGALMLYPLELNMAVPSEVAQIGQTLEGLELTKEELQTSLKGISGVLEKSSEFIREIQAVGDIRAHLDAQEQEFIKFVNENYSTHMKKLEITKSTSWRKGGSQFLEF